MEKIFFNSSMPRSGSTMISNIIGQNPDFYVTPTSGVLELIYASRSNYTDSPEFKAQDSELMKKAFLSYCRGGINGFFEGITDKKYVLDKSRGWFNNYSWLEQIYPEPKVICMVRDLRDIICSMEKNFRKSQHKANPIVNHANLSGTSTPKRVDVWLQSQPVGMAVERLAEMIRQGYDDKILFVKYEDLCLRPEFEMNRIYEYLGVPTFKHDFDNIEQITIEDDEVYGVYGDHTIRKKLEMLESNAKKILGKDVTDWIYDNFKWYMDKFNYKK